MPEMTIQRHLSFFAVLLFINIGCASNEPIKANPRYGRRVKQVAPKKDYYRPLPPGKFALRKIADTSQRPDLAGALRHRSRLLAATKRSMNYLQKPSSKTFYPRAGIEHRHTFESLSAFAKLLESEMSDAQVIDQVNRKFDTYTSVGCDDQGTVLFTGYYTPIFKASKEKTSEFRYPLHRLPPNHVKDLRTGKTLGLKQSDGSINPDYPDRRTLLASGQLDNLGFVWLRHAFEAYLIGVQGSAILELTNGERMEVGYAGNNGHDYKSLGLAMVKAGKIQRKDLNLRSMIEYFEANPEEFEPLAAENGRYIFFQESEGGPFGCLNEKVEGLASIATDKSIFPAASLCLMEAPLPVSNQRPYRSFMLDQDAGGAIRAPGRCDVFMGVGDSAGELAGHTLAEGRLYYLFLKKEHMPSETEETSFSE
ncbi:MAG: MltA domain-containing protein [Planctomycetota bacterium]|nr:MltA domain-containing protein [Planctomycetota bacterium]